MRRSLVRCTIAGVTLTALSLGCQPTRYVGFAPPSPDAPRLSQAVGDADPGFRSFYVFGLVPPRQTIDAHAVCGSAGIAEIRTERSAGQVFLSILSVGVFAPYTARITCGPAPQTAPSAATEG